MGLHFIRDPKNSREVQFSPRAPYDHMTLGDFPGFDASSLQVEFRTTPLSIEHQTLGSKIGFVLHKIGTNRRKVKAMGS